MLKVCRLCLRECRADRLAGETGFCKATSKLRVASYSSHFDEEWPLGMRGQEPYSFLTAIRDMSFAGIGI